jgi:hypothetical protein
MQSLAESIQLAGHSLMYCKPPISGVGRAILPAAGFQPAGLGCSSAAMWGRMASCGRLSIGLLATKYTPREGRLTIGLQDTILPHK